MGKRLPAPEGMKCCFECRAIKPLDEFYNDASRGDGKNCRCRECQSLHVKRRRQQPGHREKELEWSRRYRANNRDHVREVKRRYADKRREEFSDYARWRHQEKKFGLTRDQYISMLSEQGGRCKFCGGEIRLERKERTEESVRRYHNEIHTDHCHLTGLTRWLLCRNCNIGIGGFKDNPDVLERAAALVREFIKQNAAAYEEATAREVSVEVV